MRKITNYKRDKKTIVVGINLCDYGSTGNIMLNALEYTKQIDHFDVVAYVSKKSNVTRPFRIVSFATNISTFHLTIYKALSKMFPSLKNDGNYFIKTSKNLIRMIERETRGYSNIIIHLHNLHHSNLNIKAIYKYLSKKPFKVFYTMHDCWPITGGCYYYDYINCSEWQSSCSNCPLKIKKAKKQLNNRTFYLKRMKNLTFLPVSHWANSQLGLSKVSSVPSVVIHGESSLVPYSFNIDRFKKENSFQNKRILLFVNVYWNEWKGTRYIYELAKIIPHNYIIIVVGEFDKKNIPNIIQINKISHEQLVKYYTAADVYVSVTQSEQLGLTTCEAQMCGTPIVGFGNGGSKETFINGVTGLMVKNGDVKALLFAIKHVIEKKPFKKEDIISNGNKFKKYESAKKIRMLYKEYAEN